MSEQAEPRSLDRLRQVRRNLVAANVRRPLAVRAIISLVFGAIAALVLLGPLTGAKFGPIDDHEALKVLNENYELPLVEAPERLLETEVGTPGQTARYRPVYYTGRILGSSFFTVQAGAYYTLSIIFFGLMTAAFFWTSSSALGWAIGAPLVIGILDFRLWGGIWARLGTNEQLMGVGLAFVLLGATAIIGSLWRRTEEKWVLPLALMNIGVFIAAGSKENFIFAAGPLALLTLFAVWTKRAGWVSLTTTVLVSAYCLFIGWAVYAGVAKAGGDIHGTSVDSRFQAFELFFSQLLDVTKSTYQLPNVKLTNLIVGIAVMTMLVSAPLLALVRQALPPERRADYGRLLLFLAGLNVLAFAWLLWEVFFYAGQWPTGMRYDMPGILFVPVVFGSVLLAIKFIGGHRFGLPAALVVVVALAALRLMSPQPLFSVRNDVSINVEWTKRFYNDLVALAHYTKQHPDWPIYIEAEYPADYESVVTLDTWLKWKGVTNVRYLRMHIDENEQVDGKLKNWLLQALAGTSENGGYGYTPLTQENGAKVDAHECYTISYSGPVAPECWQIRLRR